MKALTANWEELLAPISSESPCGSSLRYEGEYDAVNESRRKDDPGLDQGVWTTDLKKANWENVEDICTQALRKKSKDLQLAGWLMEAWMYRYGFVGVERGLCLIINLCDEFWDDLFPLNDGDDWEPRWAPFYWINEKLSIELKLMPICQPQQGDLRDYSFADWETASKNENLIRKGQLETSGDQKNFTQSKFLASCVDSPVLFYQELTKNLRRSLQYVTDLESSLDKICGKQSPSLFNFRAELENILRLVSTTINSKIGVELQPETTKTKHKPLAPKYKGTTMTTSENLSLGTSIESRVQAYQMLRDAADYLLQTEPHSPTPYLVRRAVSWGNMTLAELLREIVKNQNDVFMIYDLLGISDIPGESQHESENN